MCGTASCRFESSREWSERGERHGRLRREGSGERVGRRTIQNLLLFAMTPEAAREKQIEKYRAMSGEERLKVAFDLHELSCATARQGIRHQYPDANADEVERRLRERISLAYKV